MTTRLHGLSRGESMGIRMEVIIAHWGLCLSLRGTLVLMMAVAMVMMVMMAMAMQCDGRV